MIRDSEQRFRSLARHAMEGIAFLEGNQIVDANEQFAILFGWKELPIGEDILSLVNPRDWQRLGARKFARSRVELQGITRNKDGPFIWRPRALPMRPQTKRC